MSFHGLHHYSIQKKMNSFALIKQLYIKAIRLAFEELQAMKKLCA